MTGQETTPNQLPGMSEFSRDGITSVGTGSGCSTGEYCTGGGQEGGTFGTTFDLQQDMTISNINRGFNFDSAVDVKSHPSNVVVPVCSNTLQASPDCRDIFSLTIKLYNSSAIGSNLVHQFEHEVELDFSGLRSYSFTDVVPENSYTALTGEYFLFGIDAGYPSGMYGPSFSSPSVTTTFDIVTLIETEIIDVISDIIESNIPIGENVTDVEIAVNTPSGDLVTTLEMEIEPPLEIQSVASAPTLAPPPTEAQMAEANIESEIQTEMQLVEPEPTAPEPASAAEPEPEPEVEPQPAETAAEPQPEPASAAEPETEPETEAAPRAAPKARGKKQDAKQKAARKIVKKMGDKGRYDSVNQIRTLIVMQVLGNTRDFFSGQRLIPQPSGFFTQARVPDAEISDNRYNQYFMFGGSTVAHDALVDSQYRE